MATNDFLPFASAVGANAATQADYAANSGYAGGFKAGVAQSKFVNKALRQSAAVSSMIGQLIADKANVNAVDDGNIANLAVGFLAMLSSPGVFTTPLQSDVSTRAATTALFAATKATNGSQNLPGGLIVQWGIVTGATETLTAALPTAFPNAMLGRVVSLQDKTAGVLNLPIYANAALNTKTQIGAKMNGYDSGSWTFSYITIGW